MHKDFKKQAECFIGEYMSHDNGVNQMTNMEFIGLMARHYYLTQMAGDFNIEDYSKYMHNSEPHNISTHTHELTEEKAKEWVNCMYHTTLAGDVIKGQHWSMIETNKTAEDFCIKFTEHFYPRDFYVALNSAWHDHHKTAFEMGLENDTTFYVQMAKDFLFDEDGKTPHERVKAYYHYMR